jgi:hypothetical protein
MPKLLQNDEMPLFKRIEFASIPEIEDIADFSLDISQRVMPEI